MPIIVTPVTIAAGESLSGTIDASLGGLVRLNMPADWTPANITFQAADAVGGPYHELVSMDGDRVIMACRPGSTAQLLGQFNAAFFKIRSGLPEAPVVQPVDRIFELVADR